jgi:hypothetical protein
MYENPEPPPKWDVRDPAKSREQFDDCLHYTNGELNLPLAYVMHEQVKPVPADQDPPMSKLYDCKRGDDCMHTPQNG